MVIFMRNESDAGETRKEWMGSDSETRNTTKRYLRLGAHQAYKRKTMATKCDTDQGTERQDREGTFTWRRCLENGDRRQFRGLDSLVGLSSANVATESERCIPRPRCHSPCNTTPSYPQRWGSATRLAPRYPTVTTDTPFGPAAPQFDARTP